MSLIRSLFFVALFLLSTLSFVVLFEHGTTNFSKNMQVELHYFEKLYHTQVEHKKDDSDKAAAGPRSGFLSAGRSR